MTGTGIDPGSCAVSQARLLLVRTLPGSCAGLCPPLRPNVQERPPRWPHPRVRDRVAAVAALTTRGRRPSAPLLPSSLETPRSRPSGLPRLTPTPAPAPRWFLPPRLARLVSSFSLSAFPSRSYLCPSCGLSPPGLRKSSGKGTPPPPPGSEGRRSGGRGGAGGGSVHSRPCRPPCSPGAGSCSFPVVFAAEGSPGARLEPGNRATWEQGLKRDSQRRGGLCPPEPLGKEAALPLTSLAGFIPFHQPQPREGD